MCGCVRVNALAYELYKSKGFLYGVSKDICHHNFVFSSGFLVLKVHFMEGCLTAGLPACLGDSLPKCKCKPLCRNVLVFISQRQSGLFESVLVYVCGLHAGFRFTSV